MRKNIFIIYFAFLISFYFLSCTRSNIPDEISENYEFYISQDGSKHIVVSNEEFLTPEAGSICAEGLDLALNGLYFEALPKFFEALSIERKNKTILNNIGISFQMLNKLDSAEIYLKRAIEIDSSYFNAHLNLGLNYFFKNEANKALAINEKVIFNSTDSQEIGSAYFHNALVYYAMKSYDFALNDLNKAKPLFDKSSIISDHVEKHENKIMQSIKLKEYSLKQ